METTFADASPDKRFFIDLITRDISLEDAILDLFDNSIDSLVRTREINLYADLMNRDINAQLDDLPTIRLFFNEHLFTIVDNCGGISFDSAKSDVFRFGHPDPTNGPSLSVFGIGMKRALFKMGRNIHIESHEVSSGFVMDLDVDDWLKDNGQEWQIPIKEDSAAKDLESAGTRITVKRLRPEVSALTKTPTFINRLVKATRETYPFYLDRHVRIFINDTRIPSQDLAFGESEDIKPASQGWTDGNVEVDVICGLLPKTKESWTMEKSGWYILCNGRVVVNADRSTLTGWGRSLPQFMPKNRGFIGMVLFASESPEDLPWKTTKRGVNTESPVFVRALKRMASIARLVIQFQNRLFASNDDMEPQQEYRESVERLSSKSATAAAAQRHSSQGETQSTSFKAPSPPLRPKLSSISFKVQKEELALVKKSLGDSNMSAKEAGEKIFKYYMEREC